MNKYDNELKGVLFKNKNKKADNHPDYTGSAQIESCEYWISGWINQSKSTGETFFKLSFKKKDVQVLEKSMSTKEIEALSFDDAIPF